jgi:anti-sigma-K factor RskA
MIADSSMPESGGSHEESLRDEETLQERESRLDDLFRAYALACPDPEPSANFMPRVWARIEARQATRNVFGRMAKALVTAALAASAILSLLVSMNSDRQYSGTFFQALTADHISQLEPFHLDRISEMEQQ